jgi:putative ABC transport system permease protein
MSDLRYAVRSLLKSKVFSAVALASLALGIGANVSVFSVVNTLLLKPLPYPDAQRLVDVHEFSTTKLCDGCGVGTSFHGFTDWKASAHSFSGMGAYLERPFAVSGTETADRIGGALVSAETFAVIGIHPAIGRGFVAEDDRVGAPPVVLLSDALWNRRYGGDRRIVGQTIRVNGVAHTVIGVMPPRFKFPEFAELWVPATPNAGGGTRDQRDFGVIARLKPGVSLAAADAEMVVIGKNLEAQYPETQTEWSAHASPLRSAFSDVPPAALGALLGAVGIVLLIVCANLAGLLLARGANRQREIAIRLALGATRWQIVRQLLTEAALLSLAGGALGMLVTAWAVDLAPKGFGTNLPFYIDFSIDSRTAVYCVGVSVLTAVIFGLLPALRASKPDVHTTLKEVGTTVRRSVLRGTMVIAELALALVLLASAGALTKSMIRLATPESGTDGLDLLRGDLEFLDARYQDRALVRNAVHDIIARLERAPGVENVAMHTFQFIAGFGRSDRAIRAEGVDSSVVQQASPRFAFVVTPGYFAAVRLPVLNGRRFDDQDREGSVRTVMINKHMADVLWPGQSPLGHRIKLGTADSLPWLTVVGVVGDISSRGRITNYAYVPFDQATTDRATLVVRGGDNPTPLIPTVRNVVRAVDQDLPVQGLQTVRQQRAAGYWPYQLYSVTIAIFAAFALLLAAIGLYGVIAYNTALRTREIGVRIALGAEAKHVLAMVMKEGGRLVAIGMVVGLAGAVAAMRSLSALVSFMFGPNASDIGIYSIAVVVLGGVALAAMWSPARRASRVSPLEALRAE